MAASGGRPSYCWWMGQERSAGVAGWEGGWPSAQWWGRRGTAAHPATNSALLADDIR